MKGKLVIFIALYLSIVIMMIALLNKRHEDKNARIVAWQDLLYRDAEKMSITLALLKGRWFGSCSSSYLIGTCEMTFSGNNSSGKEMMKYKITGLSDSTNTTVKIEIKDDRIKIINDNSELNFTLIRTGDGSLQLVGHGRESEGLLTPEIVTISMSKQLSRYRPNKFTLCYFRKVSSLNQTAQNEYLRKI